MDFYPLVPVALLGLGFLGLAVAVSRLQRRGMVDVRRDRVRRGTGHALLGLQQFVEPSVEHIFQAENLEQKDEDDEDTEDDDPRAIATDVATSLSSSPIDTEEIRRHLAAAVRAGLDWERVYDDAVRAELAARPFRAPAIPPAWRVAPRES